MTQDFGFLFSEIIIQSAIYLFILFHNTLKFWCWRFQWIYNNPSFSDTVSIKEEVVHLNVSTHLQNVKMDQKDIFMYI